MIGTMRPRGTVDGPSCCSRGQWAASGVCTYVAGTVGQPLLRRTVGLMLNRVADRAGLAKRVHPHGLRHSLAADLAASRVPVHAIQVQLGHSTISVTTRYVAHLAPTEALKAIHARQWGEPQEA